MQQQFRIIPNKLTCGLAALLLALFISNSYAGALYLYETGNPTDTGFGGAGLAARAQVAGTVFTNPAGMTRFNDSAGGRVDGEYENVFLGFFTVYAKWQ